jgi:3-mercaptopyruvate sulfurtransferase SseA
MDVGSVGSAPAASAEVWLPNAQIFDFDTRICDQSSSLPHMMPTPEVFEKEVRALGVNQESQVVVYDKVGIFSSPRAWWMFKAMGHDAVAVLDGGLPAWIAAGLPTESNVPPESLRNFRIPTGLERGANRHFRYGGYTSGGVAEAVIDPLPSSQAVIAP